MQDEKLGRNEPSSEYNLTDQEVKKEMPVITYDFT